MKPEHIEPWQADDTEYAWLQRQVHRLDVAIAQAPDKGTREKLTQQRDKFQARLTPSTPTAPAA